MENLDQVSCQWKRCVEFTENVQRGKYSEKLVVVVCKSDNYPFPRYSVKSGALRNKDGVVELFPFINPFVTSQAQNATQVDESLLIVAGLLEQAHDWIQKDAEDEAKRHHEFKQAKEGLSGSVQELVPYRPTTAGRVLKRPGKRVSPEAEPFANTSDLDE